MPELDNWTVDFGTRELDAQKSGDFQIPLDYAIQQNIEDTWSRFGYKGLIDWAHTEKLKNASQVFDEDSETFVPNTKINAEEARTKYGINLSAGNTISERAAENIHNLNEEYKYRQETIARAPQDMKSQALMFGAMFASQFLDPINLGAGFIPFIGVAREAAIIGKLGTPLGRAVVGGIEGVLGNALLEPLNWGVAKEFDYDYTAMDTFSNIAVGGAIGGIGRTVIGAAADAIAPTLRKHFSTHIDPQIHAKTLETSMGQLLSGQRVEVSPLVRLAMDEKYPNLRDISAIKYAKSAKESADVFTSNIDDIEGMIKFQEDLKGMLSEAEQKVLGLTKQSEIDLAQRELGSNINDLTEMLKSYKEAAKDLPPGEKLSDFMQTIAVIEQELGDHKEALNNLLDGRRLVQEGEQDLNNQIDNMSIARQDLEIPENADNGEVLNLELNGDKTIGKWLTNLNVSEPDKQLLRKAIIAAQDLNQIPEMTPDKIVEIATNLSSKEGQWWYEPNIVKEISEAAVDHPKVLDEAAVKESMTKVQQELAELERSLKEQEIDFDTKEMLKQFDENIKNSESFAKAIEAGGVCIMENLA